MAANMYAKAGERTPQWVSYLRPWKFIPETAKVPWTMRFGQEQSCVCYCVLNATV